MMAWASCCSRSCCASRRVAAKTPGLPLISELLLLEAGGGVLLGLVTGYIAYQAMRLIDD